MVAKRLPDLGAAILVVLLISVSAFAQSFQARQLRFDHVRKAKSSKDGYLRQLVTGKGLSYPPGNIFIRVFKRERILEVWGRDGSVHPFTHLKTYPISGFSGRLGPKRAEGDLQIPEGFYAIIGERAFNPVSNFYLSMLVNYPNASDSMLGFRRRLGGEIRIHGSDVTIGCVPITDDGIREVYWVAVCAMSNGQHEIPVHIFPTHLDSTGIAFLRQTYAAMKDGSGRDLVSFWENLRRVIPGLKHVVFCHTLKFSETGVTFSGRAVAGT